MQNGYQPPTLQEEVPAYAPTPVNRAAGMGAIWRALFCSSSPVPTRATNEIEKHVCLFSKKFGWKHSHSHVLQSGINTCCELHRNEGGKRRTHFFSRFLFLGQRQTSFDKKKEH